MGDGDKMKHNRILMSVAMAAIVLVSLCAVSVSTLSASAAQGSSSTSPVGAAVGSGAPGVCSQDGKTLDLFIRGVDNSLHWWHSADGVTWSSTGTLQVAGANALSSAAAATSPKNGTINVFVRGTDSAGSLWELTITNASTGPTNSTVHVASWAYIGGKLAANTGPSVCSYGTSTAVFVTGTDTRCYYYLTLTANSPPSSWSGLGGLLASAPAATALSDGSQFGLFVVGTNNSGLWYKHANGGKWDTSWTSVGGQALAGTSPAAYNWGASRLGWLVTGTDSKLYNNFVGNSQGYEQIKASLTSSPSVAAITPNGGNGLAVFARVSSGGTATLSQIDQTGSGWGTWTAIPYA
jgi:hypothetical protein